MIYVKKKSENVSYTKEMIRNKKAYTRKLMGIPKSSEIKMADRFKWAKKRELLIEICEQITACEELMRPLSEEDIEKLCAMESEAQIQSYCHRIKIA